MDMDSMFSGCSSLALIKVGEKYKISAATMFPDATAEGGKWWSMKGGAWYTKDEIVADRSGVADTYRNWPADDIASATVSVADQTYTGAALTPAATVKLGDVTLEPGTDYELSYESNTNAGDAKVTATGKGNYKDSASATFKIKPASIASATVSVTKQTYTGKALRPSVKVALGGRALVAGRDYTITYKNNKNVGTAKIIVKGKGNYGGTTKGRFKISPARVTSVSVVGRAAYTGRAVRPGVTVRVGEAKVPASGYSVSYRNNVKAGTATVVVRGKGNYKGSARATFSIVTPTARYTAHLQRIGWEGAWGADGDASGTTGQSKRLEAFRLELGRGFPVPGGVRYKSKVQGVGWEAWREDGQLSGTIGRSRRIEGVRVELTGKMRGAYDVYYRVHVQRLGWLGWARDGGMAGTSDLGYRVEAVQVVLVPKGADAPAATYKGVTQC